MRAALLVLFLLPGILLSPDSAFARDTLVLGAQLEPPGLDPTASAAAAIGEITFPTIYEGLVRLEAGGRIEPLLATAWEIAPGGLVYRFHLRRGVRFQDGAPFDARAVKFSLERAVAPGSPNPQKPLLDCIESVAALDPETVTLTLKHPASGLLQVLGWSAAVMVSPRSVSSDAANPVGTGPFRFAEWRRGDRIDLVRNEDYWGTKPRLARIGFRFIGDPSAALDALSTGDVDGFAAFPAPESVAWLKSNPRFHVEIGTSEGKTILAINNRRPPFDDVRVRRALSYAIDRRAIVDAAMFGYGQPIGSHYPPQDPGYVDLTGLYPHDPARARALLRAAGYPNGFEARLALPPLAYARRTGEIVTAELAEIGVKVVPQPLEWVPWLGQVFGRHDFDLTIVAHVEPMDYGIYGRDDYYFGYGKPAFKALLARLDTATGEAQRLALLGDVQRMIAADAVNVFLFEYPDFGVWDARVRDIWHPTPVQALDLAGAHFDAPGPVADRLPTAGTAWTGIAAFGAAMAALALLILGAGPGLAVRRMLSLALTLLAASVVIFAAIQLAPGDPARFMLGMNADPAALAALRAELGLDRPPVARYFAWIGGILTGDFGTSWTYRVPVAQLLAERLAVSLPLTLYALFISTGLAFALGLGAVAAKGRATGRALQALATLGLAVPNFWFGMMLVAIFGVGLHWFSAGGFPGWQAGPGPVLRALALPAIALALPQGAILGRVLEAELLAALAADHIRTARAKGLSREAALLRHALPNSLPPVLTLVGMQFSFLLAGGILIENVFFLPGLGRLVFQAIAERDLMTVESVSVVLVFEVVVVALLADLAAAAADPRLRRAET